MSLVSGVLGGFGAYLRLFSIIISYDFDEKRNEAYSIRVYISNAGVNGEFIMARRAKKNAQTAQKVHEYVTVALTASEEQAKEYEALLGNDDIPVTVKRQSDDENQTQGFAVMVPEEFVDEAYVIIESQDAYDDFYDLAIEEDADFEDDIFDEDF